MAEPDGAPAPVVLDDAEDRKLVTLARATRARTGARQGACVRDTDGRTYAAASVALPSLALGALELAVAMAVAGGSGGLEAAVLLAEDATASEHDLAVVRDLAGDGVPVWSGDARGVVHTEART